ncbi:hypothetical protein [Clostridioides sp. ES-S-0048-02]|uniref:hypothetical protein n=1 Tax=Clostridioides sp. ES-S-0048-02 TaxID=2770777 RepID=UPI001D12957C|nr:hypothetical protein [Clostridioides sp. ES-S-0048-02]
MRSLYLDICVTTILQHMYSSEKHSEQTPVTLQGVLRFPFASSSEQANVRILSTEIKKIYKYELHCFFEKMKCMCKIYGNTFIKFL